MSLRATILASTAAALFALGILFLACCTRLNGPASLCVFGLWVFVLIPSLIALPVVRWKHRERKRTIAVGVVWCAFLVGTVPAMVAGDFVLSKRVELSKLRAERVALTIERFHGEHGRYPEDLAELRNTGAPVRVPPFGGEGFYRLLYETDGRVAGYALNLADPLGGFLGGGWTWSSDRGEWKHWDF